MAKFAVTLAIIALGVVALSLGHENKIHHDLVSALQTKGSVNIVVSFDGTQSILGQVNTHSYATRGEKIASLRNALLAHSSQSQKNAVSVLVQNGIEFKTFWINNRIFINNANANIVHALSHVSEVTEIREEKILELVSPVESRPSSRREPIPEWGVADIQAPEAWAEGFTGQDVVISTIDTGARHTHEALRDNFREDHGWFDPYPTNSPTPIDKIGHGTHVTASIAGANGTGVAPGSKWIACRGCGTISCTEEALTACGQFVTCPTNPDGSDPNAELAPHVVSNSWGGGKNDSFYNSIIKTWNVAGIIPVFAIGNSGPFCETANSPGDQEINLIAVGSTNKAHDVSIFSSRGPAVAGHIKPDVCAPGSAVNSAYHTADDAYREMSGTSMATPHASGVVALMLSANPNLTFTQVFDILKAHNDRDLNEDVRQCGEHNPPKYPNTSYGHGKVNALKAVKAVRSFA